MCLDGNHPAAIFMTKPKKMQDCCATASPSSCPIGPDLKVLVEPRQTGLLTGSPAVKLASTSRAHVTSVCRAASCTAN